MEDLAPGVCTPGSWTTNGMNKQIPRVADNHQRRGETSLRAGGGGWLRRF